MMQSAKAMLVLGMHRSGTSAATRILNLLGADLGARLLDPAGDNIKGYWEHADAVDINDRLLLGMRRSWDDIRRLPENWETSHGAEQATAEIQSLVRHEFDHTPLWAIKDPRLCRVVPAWTAALSREGVEPLFLFVMRHPAEVAQSLAKRDGTGLEFGYALWLRYVTESELATRRYRRVMIRYDDLLNDWRGCMDHVSQSLGIDLMGGPNAQFHEEIDSYLDVGDRHHWAGRKRWMPFATPKIEWAAINAYRTVASIIQGRAKWEDLQSYGRVLDRSIKGLNTSSVALLDMLQCSRATQFKQKVGYEKALGELNESLGERDQAIARLEFLAKARLEEVCSISSRLAETDRALGEARSLAKARLEEMCSIDVRLAKTDQALSEAESLAIGRLEELHEWAARVKELEAAYAKVELLALERLAVVESLTQYVEKTRS